MLDQIVEYQLPSGGGPDGSTCDDDDDFGLDGPINLGDQEQDHKDSRTRVKRFTPNIYTRFLRLVDTKNFDPDVCWPWVGGASGKGGYGEFNLNGRIMGAHRASYELFVGPIPEGQDICHTCDFRACQNPDHLFPGSRKENMEDCKAKGRTARGVRKHLHEATIQEIRRRLCAGHDPRKIANQMDLAYETIVDIRSGKRYAGIGVVKEEAAQ
jgi:hypothetical protein